MQFHSLSLADHGFQVSLVGFPGTDLPVALKAHPFIEIHHLPTLDFIRGLPFLLMAPLKLSFQIFNLFYLFLVVLPKMKFILIQNPPAIPTLLVVQLVALLTGAKIIIDWHNLAYSILALR